MKRQTGFTLIELMITVVVIGILMAVAIPNYSRYMVRTRLADAYTGLSGVGPNAEQFWSSNRTYEGLAEAEGLLPAATDNFEFSVTDDEATTYTVLATGRNALSGFVFSVDQNGNRKTVAAPDGWAKPDNCWVKSKEGECSQ